MADPMAASTAVMSVAPLAVLTVDSMVAVEADWSDIRLVDSRADY